jgi:3' exoribonuclease, RNase T-like
MCYLFIDTEFTDFSPMELMSLGVVSEDGKHEFYVEIDDHNPNIRSSFVNQVVVPLMDMRKHGMPYVEAAAALSRWLNELPGDDVTIVVDYTGDYQLFDKLLKAGPPCTKKIYYKMLTQALMHMLHSRGIHATDGISKGYAALMNETPKYFLQDPRQHHALVDAKANRHGWIAAYEAAK